MPGTPENTINPACLCEETLAYGVDILCGQDCSLAEIVRTCGPPPLWAREAGFATLIRIILEQQVSLASAKAAFQRLLAAVDPLTADLFLKLDDFTLKALGFSRQKMGYGRNLARAIAEGCLDIAALSRLDDETARSELTKIKGIGAWTADIFLLMALRRPDIWPNGDLALAVAIQHLKKLKSRPTPREIDKLSESWKPWRAVAARLLWHYYLCRIA
jgi:DNA-3-methyladenine glycosylase II